MLLATLVACWACTRGVWHGLDGYQFLSDIDHGALFHDRHVLYKPVAWLCSRALEPLGLSLFSRVVAASAIATAIGAAFSHRALLGFGLDRRQAALAATLVAGCFSVLYFGTVIEMHGVFFGFAGFAWWCYAKYLQQQGWLTAIFAGAATGIATAAHATGQLLPGALAACTLAWSPSARQAFGRYSMHMSLLFAAHFASAALTTTGLLHLTSSDDPSLKKGLFEGTLSFVSGYLAMGTVWSNAPRLLLQEWILPFWALSLLPFAALFRSGFRREGLLLCICVVVYLAATTVLLSPVTTLAYPQYLPPLTLIEYGAYFLPLAIPCAALGVRMVRSAHLLAAATLLWTGYGIWRSDRPARDDAFGIAALEAIDAEKASILCGGFAELDSLKRLRPALGTPQFLSVYELQIQTFNLRDQMTYPYATTGFDALYGLAQNRGGVFLVTEDAMKVLAATGDGFLDRLAKEHIPEHYVLTPYVHGALRGYRVTRKS